MKVLVIGAGNMGLAYADAIARSEHLKKGDLLIYDNAPQKQKELQKVNHFEVQTDLTACVDQADIVFLAVKPYHIEELFAELKPRLQPDQIAVSIMAGVSIQTMQTGLGLEKVVRAMPNLPAQVGKGITTFTASDAVSRLELSTVESILDTTGRSIQLDNENDIDASTGISGSGPAYVFYFMQSMLEAALKMGFSDYDAKALVSVTFEGAVELFKKHKLSPENWMDRVASEGGTTRAALDSMEDNNVKELIQEAAFAAFNRAVELGKEANA